MSYAGLKSMIFAGLKEDDPRVKAAVQWAAKSLQLSENPGLGDEGLFYYYHLFGKAIAALGQEELVDSKAPRTTGAPTWLPSSGRSPAARWIVDERQGAGWKGTRTW